LALGVARAEVPIPAPTAPGGSVVPLSGPVTLGNASVTEAPRLVRSRTHYSQAGATGDMEIRFSSFVTKTQEGGKDVVLVRGEDFSMDMPGMPTPPADKIREMVSKVEAKAVVDRSSGAVDVSVTGGDGPTAASVEQFARVLAKGLFGGRTLKQGEEVLSYDTEDLGTAGNTGMVLNVSGTVAGRSSGGGRDYVVISGEGPATAQGQEIGRVVFMSYVDEATGVPAWTRTSLVMNIPDPANPMSMDMEQIDEVMILE
jgi:hypothetical protein